MINSKIKVLIIDDDSTIRFLYKKYLKFKGIDVIDTLSNGLDAIEKLKNLAIKPEIILVDYQMPIINGIEVSKKILDLNKSAKIIMISSDKTIREEALSLGIVGFYEKSINLKTLYKKITEIYNKKYN